MKPGKGHKKTTAFRLQFDAPLNTTTAADTALYRVQQAMGKGKRARTLRPVAITSAVVGDSGETVMLTLGHYRTNAPLQLTLTGLVGIDGAAVAPIETQFRP